MEREPVPPVNLTLVKWVPPVDLTLMKWVLQVG